MVSESLQLLLRDIRPNMKIIPVYGYIFDRIPYNSSAHRLMLTGGHAIPDQNCLLKMYRFTSDAPNRVSFFTNTGGTPSNFSPMEDDLYKDQEDPKWQRSPVRSICVVPAERATEKYAGL